MDIRKSGIPSRWLPLIVLVVLAASTIAGWALRRPDPSLAVDASAGRHAAERVEQAPAQVEAVRVRRSDLPLLAQATGYLEPWRKVEIRAESAGRVVERRMEEGGRVAAGGLLVRLDDRDRLIEVEETQAEWLKIQASYAVDFQSREAESGGATPAAQAAADAAERYRRAESLLREGLISKQELDEARRQYEAGQVLSGARRGEVRAATSGLAQAEQRLKRSQLALERTRIVAPFSGRVADLTVEVGQQISPGEALFTLIQDDRLKVDVDVLEADMVRVREGAPARVRIPSSDNLVLAGTVYTINPRIDPKTGAGRVTVAIPNPRGLLLAGLFATVELETGRLHGRLAVPSSALLSRQSRDLVFRIENGLAVWTYVTVGARSGDMVEIVDGLSEGDLVATSGHFALAHEAPVIAATP